MAYRLIVVCDICFQMIDDTRHMKRLAVARPDDTIEIVDYCIMCYGETLLESSND